MSAPAELRRRVLAVLLGVLVSLFVASVAGAQDAPGEGVQGTLQYRADDAVGNERVPLEGGAIVVYVAELSADGRSIVTLGEEVARGGSDADGRFSIDVPGPGDYAVELQLDSLPETVELVDPDRQTLALSITNNQRRSVLFNLAEGDAAASARDRETDSVWTRGARLLVEGIKFGLIIGMCAVGLSLIFGTTGLVNFAHGEMITLGAIIAYVFNSLWGLNLVVATILAMVVGGFFGAGLDLGLWRPLRRRGVGLVSMMIISIGLALFLRFAMLFQFGERRRPYDDYAVQTEALVTLGPVSLPPKDVFMIVSSALILVAVAMALRTTKIGKAMRAVSDNPDLAASTGIDVNRTITTVWFAGGFLVTLGGVYQGLSEQIQYLMGQQLLLLVFAGVTLGGLGTDFGAMVGSLIVGIFVFVSTLVIPPELKSVGALLVLIAILMVRPQGIFGRRERIG